jgi:hypothetical protein
LFIIVQAQRDNNIKSKECRNILKIAILKENVAAFTETRSESELEQVLKELLKILKNMEPIFMDKQRT